MIDHSSSPVQEFTTPALVDVDSKHNVTDLVSDRLVYHSDHPAFNIRSDGEWKTITTSEFWEEVSAVAKGLIASGIKPGDSVAIMGATSYQWAVADMALFCAGAVVIPVFESSSAHQVRYIVNDAVVKAAFVDTVSQKDIIEEAGLAAGWPLQSWALNDKEDGFSGLIKSGATITDEELETRRLRATLDDLATVVYTSGTEGTPKGVDITHRNLVGQILNIGAAYTEVVRAEGSTLIFLPLAHVLARGLQLICLSGGMTITHESNPKQAIASLGEVKPTFLVVVPRVLQKIRENIALTASEKHLGFVWRKAEETAIAWGEHREAAQSQAGLRPRLSLALRHRLYDQLFYRRVRELLGGKIEYLLCGAAPMGRELGLLFQGMGINVIEGYGLTETTAPLTGNVPTDIYSGTVGRPQPGHTVRISPTGEVLAAGIGVSPGYHNPDNNRDAFEDGFFRTGDLGVLDEEGRLTITGRVKDVIVTSGGKTFSPRSWEEFVEQNPLVAHAVVIGDAKPYPAALLLLDPDQLGQTSFSLSRHVEGLIEIIDESIINRIRPSIEHANQEVSQPERVKRFRLLAGPLEPGNPLVTPTMKLRRQQLLGEVKSIVDSIYSGSGPE